MRSLELAFALSVLAAIAGCLNASNSEREDAAPNWPFRTVTETSGATSHIFEGGEMPPLTLAGTVVVNYGEVNAALEHVGLPLVNRNVMEQETLTGFRSDRASYHWDDYELGTLIMQRSTGKVDGKTRDVIWKLTIRDTQ